MDDVQFMEVLDSRDDLLEELAGLFFLQGGIGHDIIEEFPSGGVLHDQIELSWRFNYLKELNDVGVSDHLKDLDFPLHALHVCLLRDLLFLQDLHSHLLSC
eukprot:CAMPEP_0170552134 /NCGR_PEP_ID=MMETSP0211-20121228/10081_1 /TAXON_ID=311385 /ORGANISM="Pseudokeronopsis sp., Strain OXSARD2" /LENGTH=100 /DNA_ID=CAMNT_0010859695 /DNA_START=2519 /DNA_END=2821 /DNA_ORIENTATION=-